MNNNYQILINKLDAFIRKYYKNMLLRGAIYSATLLMGFFILFTSVEYFGQFDTTGRTILFYSYIILTLYVIAYYIIIPLLKLNRFGKIINRHQAAQIVGNHFNEVKDKLLNVLQLEHLAEKQQSQLLIASIDQKSIALKPIPFSNAVNLSENKKHIKFLLIPILLIIAIWSFLPDIFSEGTQRLVNHSTYIEPLAPFTMEITNKKLSVLKNKNYTLDVKLTGNQIPNKIYIEYNDSKIPLTKTDKLNYNFTFKNVQEDQSFKLYASGFYSKTRELKVIPNPLLTDFSIQINYPKYLNKTNETSENNGNLIIPEGTELNWIIQAEDADFIYFIDANSNIQLQSSAQQFNFKKTVKKSHNYAIIPSNSYVEFGDTVQYSLQVIPDKFPTISVNEKIDSTNENRIYFKGKIGDDYGFSALNFHYQILTEIDSLPDRNNPKTIKIPFNSAVNIDEFFHFWNLEAINLLPGDEITYYFTVWDNDGVNGRKSTKSIIKTFKTKTLKERDEHTTKSNDEIKNSLSESIKNAKDIQKELEKLKKKLTDKKEISWEEKQKLKNLLEKQKELEKQVNEIQQQNKQNNQQQNQYKQYSEEILQKQEQLQKLFDELMTDEMKKMMEKLQEMMDKLDKNMFENELEKMELSNKDLEKELDRSLELFKQMEFEQKLDDVKNKLDDLTEDQKQLSEKTEKKEAKDEVLEKEQNELNKEFDELKKELDDLKKLDEELERPNGMKDTKKEQEEISSEMKKSSDQLQKGNNKKSSKSQKDAAKKMEELSQDMAALQQQAQNQGEDMDALRQLLDNLIHLSFDQEDLMEKYKTVNTKSPEYVKITQQQQKLKEDAKMIEDSLFALSKRVVQLKSTINKEINAINSNMDKSIHYMAERQTPMAASRQQYVMTSVNNLALLFDEALQQMQAQMKSQKQGKGSCNKPGGNGKPKPGFGSIKKMQEQLSKQLEQMKKAMEEGNMPGGKKKGKEKGKGMGLGNSGMSESLAKMAAQQAKIREELNKLKNSEGGGSGINGMSKLMEENESDIVNKRITQETINRQKQILTRLLESEKAEREREWDEKRESKEGKNENKRNPEMYFEYNKEKEKEIDLLKTTPPNLSIFYKNKVNQYFQNMNQ